MTKTYLAIAFLITGFLVGDAYGEEVEVFYCAETDNNGFQWNYKRQTYERRYFEAKKFKAKCIMTSKNHTNGTERIAEAKTGSISIVFAILTGSEGPDDFRNKIIFSFFSSISIIRIRLTLRL